MRTKVEMKWLLQAAKNVCPGGFTIISSPLNSFTIEGPGMEALKLDRFGFWIDAPADKALALIDLTKKIEAEAERLNTPPAPWILRPDYGPGVYENTRTWVMLRKEWASPSELRVLADWMEAQK